MSPPDGAREALAQLLEEALDQRELVITERNHLFAERTFLLAAGVVERSGFPADAEDLAACRRARETAPPHLWPAMDAMLLEYEDHVRRRWGESGAS